MPGRATYENWSNPLDDLAESGVLGFMLAGLDGTVIAANDAMLALIGRGRRDLEAHLINWLDLTAPEWRYLDLMAFEEVRSRRSATPYEKKLLRPDGTHVSVLTSLVPARASDALASGFAIDVTRRHREVESNERMLRELASALEDRVARRTADLRETAAEFETFCHIISHNLKGPLRSIHAYADLMIEELTGRLGEAGSAYLRSIAMAAGRMDALIRDLLDYARLVRARPVSEAIALNVAVADAIDALRARIDDAGAEVIVDVSDRLPAVWGHSTELVVAISHLIVNAVTFVAAGVRPCVRIVGEQRDGSVRLWVEDNGIGIAPEHHQRVFWLFERIAPEAGQGSGVGLALVRRTIELMYGSVGLESSPGRGSRFWIELPVAPGVAPEGGYITRPSAGVSRPNREPDGAGGGAEGGI